MVKTYLKNYKKWLFPGALLVALLGMFLLRLGMRRPMTIRVDGQDRTFQTSALTVSGALRAGGITVDDADQVNPPRGRWVWNQSLIEIQSAREVMIHTPEETYELFTSEPIPANLIQSVGLTLFPQDQVWINGTVVDPAQPIQPHRSVLLQVEPAEIVTVTIDGSEYVIHTHQPTLGEALEAASFQIGPEDWISQDLMTPIAGAIDVEFRRANPVMVEVGGQQISGMTAARTVGEALQDLTLPLQNLDFSIPADDSPLPEDRRIMIVPVSEEILIMMDEVPFENEYIEDPETLLDQVSVVEPGQVGIFATRERIQYANGEEVWRDSEDQWQASEAEDGVLGYGTRVEIRTEVVDGQTIEYWRKISVYATSYSPCRHGTEECRYGTATGMPVARGTVAVTPRWISVPNGYGMWGQSVYIPGYGFGAIGDTGGGIPGTPWIDLAYSDEDYVSWHNWTTLYFLTPVPGWYPTIIYP